MWPAGATGALTRIENTTADVSDQGELFKRRSTFSAIPSRDAPIGKSTLGWDLVPVCQGPAFCRDLQRVPER